MDFDTNITTTITAHDAGYVKKEGWKNRRFTKRISRLNALHPFGGVNMIKSSFHYGREMDADFGDNRYRPAETHNQGVFDVYSPDMLRCRKSGVLTPVCRMVMVAGALLAIIVVSRWHGIRYLVRERELQFADLQSESGAGTES